MFDRRQYDTFINTVCPAGHPIKYQGDLLKPIDQQAFALLLQMHAHCRPTSDGCTIVAPAPKLLEHGKE